MKPYFPKSHGVPRVDDLRVISGIIHVHKIGLQWRDAPREYCPHKTLYNRFIRWSEMGVFNKIFKSLKYSNLSLRLRAFQIKRFITVLYAGVKWVFLIKYSNL